jgi:hypothetical protein
LCYAAWLLKTFKNILRYFSTGIGFVKRQPVNLGELRLIRGKMGEKELFRTLVPALDEKDGMNWEKGVDFY